MTWRLERLELFHGAAHRRPSDNLGVVPDPIVGEVVNFVDAARPLVTLIGPQNLPVLDVPPSTGDPGDIGGGPGSARRAADEKAELVSQKMTISRLTATAVTYGGYVNVSRQDIDFSSPQIMDIIINDLASRYAIQTEAATGTTLDGSTSTNVGYGRVSDGSDDPAAIWSAASTIFTATAGQGRVVLALAPDRLNVFGPLFTPIVSVAQTGDGLSAGDYSSGSAPWPGSRRTCRRVWPRARRSCSPPPAIDVFEQRVGTLQVWSRRCSASRWRTRATSRRYVWWTTASSS